MEQQYWNKHYLHTLTVKPPYNEPLLAILSLHPRLGRNCTMGLFKDAVPDSARETGFKFVPQPLLIVQFVNLHRSSLVRDCTVPQMIPKLDRN